MDTMSKSIILAALEVTTGNIKSLGPAGALGGIVWSPFEEWLAAVERALELARLIPDDGPKTVSIADMTPQELRECMMDCYQFGVLK